MGKKLLILIGVIGVTACLYYGLEMIKTSSTVDVENTTSTNQIVEQIKQEINSYAAWNIESYKMIKSKIELKATMQNINLQEKTTLNTLLENKNSENLKIAFAQAYVACKLSSEINSEIDRLSETTKYNEFFKEEKQTLKYYKYVNYTLKSAVNTLCSSKYHEGSYKSKFKLIAKYFTPNVLKCNKMSALKNELKKKLEIFQGVGISFDNMDIENNNEEWKLTPADADGKTGYYNMEYCKANRFKAYEGYKYYKDKLKSLNILLSDGTYLFQ